MKNGNRFFCGGGLNSHFLYNEISSRLNLFRAWNEFKQGKIQKQDVSEFSVRIEDHLFELSDILRTGKYRHSNYMQFYIFDPKRRHIHKASVVDRLLHHATFRVLQPIYDRKFIFDSYSSRHFKGTHKAQERFRYFAWKLSRNNTRTVWVLKGDIRKFFDSIDHDILMRILRKTIHDDEVLSLLEDIITSFETRPRKGIPLGNLTSQLFSNVYLDQLDQYVKRKLRIKYYVRYADDFVVLGTDKSDLTKVLSRMTEFLEKELALSVHPDKVYIRKFSQGIDFLGHVIFPYHSVLRTKTKKRIFRKVRMLKSSLDRELISKDFFDQSMASYYGLLEHCQGKGVKKCLDGILKNNRREEPL